MKLNWVDYVLFGGLILSVIFCVSCWTAKLYGIKQINIHVSVETEGES